MLDWRFNRMRSYAFLVLHAWRVEESELNDGSRHVPREPIPPPIPALAPPRLPVLDSDQETNNDYIAKRDSRLRELVRETSLTLHDAR